MIEEHEVSGDSKNNGELEVLQLLLSSLQNLDQEVRERVMRTVSTFFKIGNSASHSSISTRMGGIDKSVVSSLPNFSENRAMSPKLFILDKQAHTDVERVACLAYYLTHYQETPYFKTLDISKLNTEAAQRKFANPAKAVENATTYGYLTHAPAKGRKQLSAAGEIFVQALPDRDEAKRAMSAARPKRKKLKSKKKRVLKSALRP